MNRRPEHCHPMNEHPFSSAARKAAPANRSSTAPSNLASRRVPPRGASRWFNPMLRGTVSLLGGLLLAQGSARADAPQSPASAVKVQPVIPIRAYAFDLTQVRLLEGPFKHAMELDQRYLLELDPGRLLHTFRVNAGLASSARPLGGWEEPKGELRGHFAGHYLSACALMFASTGDARFKQKGDYIVAELAKCQAAVGSGYLSAYPEEFFDRVERLQRVWAPYYTLHKIFAGLLDMHVHAGNPEALEVARKFADWVIARNGRLTDEQMQRMLGNEHGGMNETLANLYGLTGDQKYLRIARRFNHQAVIGPASQRQDNLTRLHANTQIPKFIGTAREFELTADESLKTASLFFWETVVRERSYVIGGHSDGEMFSPKERLSQALGPSTTETCNTYNMLKLTRHLFCWNPQAEYADYYERALYNHILCSQNPESGMMCYYVPLRSGSHKEYNTPNDSFWCCTGTGVENHAKYGDSIYFHDGQNGLYLNLFIASELDWQAKGVRLRQETRFPDETATRLVLTCKEPIELALHLRHPYWALAGFTVAVNGSAQSTSSQPGSYAVVKRTWRSGDTVELSMPFTLRTEGFRDNPSRFAFMHGPLVLGAQVAAGRPLPAIVGNPARLFASLAPVAGRSSTFAAPADFFRAPGEAASGISLEPLFRIHGNRHYVVYWDNFTPEQWVAKEAEVRAEQARQRELEARTVDVVNPGEEQNERDHKLAGDRTESGDFGGHRWRHATDGGWFAYELKVLPDQPQELACTFWGSDGGGREFDILIDGVKIATQRLERNRPDRFYQETFPLSAAMLQGKQSITVRLQALPGRMAGGLFGCRVLKKAP